MSLTLVPLAVAISLALGWDSFVGLGISMVSIAFGYTAATFNPFNVGILQTMADLPLFSGLAYRVLFFALRLCVARAVFNSLRQEDREESREVPLL